MNQEINKVVNEVCEKFQYDSTDREGNDSLKTVLIKICTVMLKDSNEEDRNLFYEMLRHTPIVITEGLTPEGYKRLEEKYIGNVNPHIVEEKSNVGEYGKNVGAGAYVSEPILDENLQLKGKKSFLYIQKVNNREQQFFGTDINVFHLIHELGHAWHAEKDQYTMLPNNTLKNRTGTAEFIYSFSKNPDGTYTMHTDKVSGLMLEEGMNTLCEEQAMANYMNISLEEMKDKYRTVLIPSSYQGYIANFVSYMLQQLNSKDFEQWRMYGDSESKGRIESLMSRTKYWENREQDILPTSDSPRNYNNKRQIIAKMQGDSVQEFFKHYENIYFPDISQMSPLDKIENVLEQFYNMSLIKYSIDLEDYKAFLNSLGYEGYSLINQSSDIKKKDELLNSVSDVSLSEFNKGSKDIRSAVLQEQNRETDDKGENR